MRIETNWDGVLADQKIRAAHFEAETIWQGKVVRVQRDHFQIFDIPTTREVVAHPGAVGVIAVNSNLEVALVRQYRQPVRSFLFEPIAGLLDQQDESPLNAAKRELLEEAGLVSENWSHLIDLIVSPGGSTEIIRFYLAENSQMSQSGRIWSSESEEKELPLIWVSETEFINAILSDRIHNSVGISGVLAAFAKMRQLDREPTDKPWPLFELLSSTGGLGSYPLN